MLRSNTRSIALFLALASILSLGAGLAGAQSTTGSTGGGGSHSNMQPSLALNYMIALTGVFPSRSTGGDPALGEISIFAGNFAPRGWALCEGQLLPIGQNQALFSLLGTIYGGDGRTTFALPDLRGRTAIGAGNGPGLTDRRLGAKGGSESITLNLSQIPSHSHSVPPTTGAAGSGFSHTNMQPWLAINYVVPTVGVFPSRNLGGSDSYLASVEMFAGNFAPRPTTMAHGQILPINQNQALFSLLGTTYGGDGRTSFALPDLRGRVPVGQEDSPLYSLGERKGAESIFLNTSELPSHTHTLPGTPSATTATGGSGAHTNLQPGLGLNYIITLQGLFPSRSIGQQDFIGEVGIFAGNFAPRERAFCDGRLLPIASHTALFSILGTTYGGNGRTDFALPDLRGRVAIGAGRGPGLSSYPLGAKVGSENITLVSAQMPPHPHELPTNTWTGEDCRPWTGDSEWTLGQSPTANHNAYLNNGNTAVLNYSGQQCATLFLGHGAGDIGRLEVWQSGSLSVGDGAYVGLGGLGSLHMTSGGRVSADIMSIANQSALRLHVDGDGMVVLGGVSSQGSVANSGVIGLYADAFLAGGTYTPISDFSGGSLLWSGSGVLKAFGGEWVQATQAFGTSTVTPLGAGVVHSVQSNDRLLITDGPSGDRVSVSFADVAGPVNFSASVMGAGDQAALEAILPPDFAILGAWDFATNLPDGDGAFLAFEVDGGSAHFRVWHLDGGAWSLFDPEFKSFDVAGGIAGFTVDSFSGYAVTTPEPGTLALLSLGGIMALRRRRRREK